MSKKNWTPSLEFCLYDVWLRMMGPDFFPARVEVANFLYLLPIYQATDLLKVGGFLWTGVDRL